MDISEKPQFELDIQKILIDYRNDYNSATGFDIYHRVYKITELLGKLGVCQEHINTGAQAIWDGANHINNLSRLAKLKEKFKEIIVEIVKNWLEIANILKLPEYVIKEKEFPLSTLSFVETIATEEDSTDPVNVLFYIYFLIENLSDFASVCKTLCELCSDTSHLQNRAELEESDLLQTSGEEGEICSQEEMFFTELEVFLMFMLFMKLIAIKSGINFEASIQETFRR